jgi:hypothetical protein
MSKAVKSKPSDLLTTTVAVSVHRASDDPIFGESVLMVSVDNTAGGPFIVVKSNEDNETANTVRMDLDELEAVVVAARKLVADYPDPCVTETQKQ